jgi:hypothetical protein
VVAEGLPERLALVPINAPEQSPNRFKQVGCFGERTPTLLSGVSIVGTISREERIMVNGPGQKLAAIRLARSVMYARFSASAKLFTKTGIGFVRSPFTSIVLLIADEFRGSHPKPYTVSVG